MVSLIAGLKMEGIVKWRGLKLQETVHVFWPLGRKHGWVVVKNPPKVCSCCPIMSLRQRREKHYRGSNLMFSVCDTGWPITKTQFALKSTFHSISEIPSKHTAHTSLPICWYCIPYKIYTRCMRLQPQYTQSAPDNTRLLYQPVTGRWG